MDTKIYILFASIYFFLGIVSVVNFSFKDVALKIFIVLTVLLPITKFTTTFHTIYQLSFYYFFFIGPLILFFLKLFSNHKFKLNLFLATILLAVVFGLYVTHYLFLVDEPREFTNILKDAKLFVLLPLGFVFIEVFYSRLQNILTKEFCVKLLWANVLVLGGVFYLMVTQGLHLKLTSDPYYKYEELRLETLGSYFGIFYLTSAIFSRRKLSFIEVILCLGPLLFTGNRTLIFSVLVAIGLFYLTRLSLNRIIIFFTSSFVLLSSFVYLVLRAEEGSPLSRFQLLLDPEYIQYALLNRFSPFFSTLKDFSGFEYIVGKGMGFTFFIPWFHYRVNIDNYNIYIDDLYLTLYAKFGIFFIVFFVAIFLYLKTYNSRAVSIFYFVFVLILSVTNAFIYQYNFLWIFILFAFPFNTKNQLTENKI